MIHYKQHQVRYVLLAALTILAAPVSADHRYNEFEDIFIRVEKNATDNDTEVVFGAKPDSDMGLRRIVVRSPYWDKVVSVKSPRRILGQREFLFESPEPPDDEILTRYPQGTYTFYGVATNGEKFLGQVELSHDLPATAEIFSPQQDDVVSSDAVTIQWSQVDEAVQFILELENESSDPEQTLLINLPAGTTRFDVPASMLSPGAEYQIGIGAVAENGNIVFSESQFSTAE